jgi:GNAT superfamily N-acetyltransferase
MPRPRSTDAPGAPDRWGYVANVYVDRAARAAGVGGRLLDAATTYADDEGFARLVLSPSERSVPFYERAGFGTTTSLMLRPGR